VRPIKVNTNPHHVLLMLGSMKGAPKSREELHYIAYGKTPVRVGRGLKALVVRGLAEKLDDGKYQITESGAIELHRLSQYSPHTTYNNTKADAGIFVGS